MGVWLWPSDKAAVIAVEVAKFTMAEKSATSLQQCQVHVDRFFDIQGIVHKEFVPPGQTINGKFYCRVLKRLREDNRLKHPDKWKKNNWLLHHDNTPAHTSLVRQFLTSKNITVIPPPIRRTLPPATFSYSPRWNYGWKGVILTRLRRSTQKRKRLSTHSHLRTSRDAWNHGKHTGIAVYMPKGATSKETVETRSYSKKLFFNGLIPRIFG